FCHGELAAGKPDARYLTRFYLMLSFGGAAGGMFVGLLAPNIFTAFWELPLGLAGITVVAWLLTKQSLKVENPGFGTFITPTVVVVCLAVVAYFAYDYDKLQKMDNTIAAERNFYGRLSVKQIGYGESDPDSFRVEMHGTIQHGKQFLHPAYRWATTSYYGESSGIGIVLGAMGGKQLNIGGVGMGVGTIAGYARPGDTVKFYEINPAVTAFAKKYFYYLNDHAVEVATGDGRLLLERESPQQFDVLAIDAFSGDAVPVHLITREALALYLKHIKPDGAVAFHITSRYLDLAPVVQKLSEDAGYEAALVVDRSSDNYYSPSSWVIVTRNPALLNIPELLEKRVAAKQVAGMKLWTDDYSNLFQVLK
ncbi:MAG: spermidine synthase, partial [Pseudomonadota bacterium]